MLESLEHIAYITGYPDNTVRPQGNVTREEVAAVFYRLLNDDYRDSIRTTNHNFLDVGLERWSLTPIGTLSAGRIIMGYPNGTFMPSKYITRAELAVIASRFDKLSEIKTNKFSDITIHWAEKAINSAADKGWVHGYPDGTYKPNQYITRAEFMALVNNVLNRKVHLEQILPNSRKFPDLVVGTWYYETVQEAINSHLYELMADDYEEWTEIYNPEIEW